MVGTIWGLALASAFLLASHFGIASTKLRPALVKGLGENAYLGLYSLVAAVAFGWLVWAYGAAPYVALWAPAGWTAWIPVTVMPVALLLIVGGLTVPNPTSVKQEKALFAEEPARGLLRITRHPFLWGVGLWGLSHLPSNGDLASLLFFGSLAALGIVGATLIDARKRALRTHAWARFEEATSFVPFAAILAGRQSLGRAAAEFGILRLLAVTVLYGALLHLHPWLFGVYAIPTG